MDLGGFFGLICRLFVAYLSLKVTLKCWMKQKENGRIYYDASSSCYMVSKVSCAGISADLMLSMSC